MTVTHRLRGLTWDHPRGYDPLVACAARYAQDHPHVSIEWHKRSLHDFGAFPIEELARSFDLLVIDHPFMGQAARTRCFLDLREWIAADVLDALVAQGVGPSGPSYAWDKALYALPTDAAAHVASYRPELMAALDAPAPRDWQDVVRLAARARANGQTLAWAGTPTDAACTLLTLAANLGHAGSMADGEFLPGPGLAQVMGHLHWLAENAQASCLDDNPIRMYEQMVASDRMVYCPAAFGYSNYARAGRTPWLQFAPLAGPGKVPSRGALLGGAGMAISRHSDQAGEAARFVAWLHGAEVQGGLYLEAGGQPGSAGAWRSDHANAQAHDFFARTLPSLDGAFVRPRFAGFVPFIEAAGVEINRCLRGQCSLGELRRALDTLYGDAWSSREQGRTPLLQASNA
ncbi:ABC transporter substrate-binding protein [Variovorax sp. UMC13]|uniref:ABC transporter substrate-binding protein n=1 Tax=Variovorax sp. UMC13 TaxID=1862326 RepID=UPI0016015183|nr:ABC transporter substrate-binding protein [Variovorax sp. UMC13]MBB1598601.1 hypothetical protein [Variovorax sp. UMC13]